MKCCSFTKLRNRCDFSLVSIDDLAAYEQTQAGASHGLIAGGHPVETGEYIRQIFSGYPGTLITEFYMCVIIFGIQNNIDG